MSGSYKIALLIGAVILLGTVAYWATQDDEPRVRDTAAVAPPSDLSAEQPSAQFTARPAPIAEPQPLSPDAASSPDDSSPADAASHDARANRSASVSEPAATPALDDQPTAPLAARTTPTVSTAAVDSRMASPAPAGATDAQPQNGADVRRPATPSTIAPQPADAVEVAPLTDRSPTRAAVDVDDNGASSLASPQTYTIQPGDTFSSIARERYGDERAMIAIAQANPFVDPMRLRVGQEIRLPSAEDVQQREQAEDDADDGRVSYTVRPGDTLSRIAARFYNDASMWRTIYAANRQTIGADPNDIQAGDRLHIPPVPRQAQ